MSKAKAKKPQKGLSDAELIKKYEAGKFEVKKIMTAMLTTTPPKQVKSAK